jgi:hypothetical protein
VRIQQFVALSEGFLQSISSVNFSSCAFAYRVRRIG